ncbi:hypothetical protein NA57DRAFT_53115 [Rhizodiscina lignyota]|uniref:Uncharacterized protein n=1 Tax=Rhizodiscina lignyota TaxID=1504668 RepID=A0A9P4MFJ7_9PEZI|nr:hypothetical protein NA57DRAFT_53115 [Rhizodiscina lignyota]
MHKQLSAACQHSPSDTRSQLLITLTSSLTKSRSKPSNFDFSTFRVLAKQHPTTIMPASTVENQPQVAREQMVAQPGAQNDNVANNQQENGEQERQPRLSMRGGGLILDLCACFICCEACKGCCEAIDDCCCC